MLTFAESCCAYAGISLFAAGFVCLFVPRHFRLGVVSMLTGDLFFALAIAFPKNITAIVLSLGISKSELAEKQVAGGVLLGMLLFALLYGLRLLQKKFFPAKPRQDKSSQPTDEKDSTTDDSPDNTLHGMIDRKLTNSLETADPKLFSKVVKKS